MRFILASLTLYILIRTIVSGWVLDRELYQKELHKNNFHALKLEDIDLREESMRRCLWRNDVRRRHRSNSQYGAYLARLMTSSSEYLCEERIPKMSNNDLIKTFSNPIKTNAFVDKIIRLLRVVFVLPIAI